MMGVVLALVSAAAYGMSDFLGGIASRRIAALRVVLVSYPISAVIIAIAAAFVGGEFSWRSMLFGAASGLVMALAMWWFYIALAEGPMSVVSPLTAVIVAGIPVIVGVVGGERPSVVSYGGIALAIVAVILVSREPPGVGDHTVSGAKAPQFTRRVAWFTVGAGVCFALSFVFTHQIEVGTGLWPLVVARTVASVIVIAIAAGTGQFVRPPGDIIGFAILVAVLDVIGVVTMLYAFQGGLLSLVSVLISLYPAVTVLLAVLVLKERVGRMQLVGMGLALTAIAAIAVNG
ncbi:EamA family transporter [Cryobacterium roopkundense]|uniref:Drug/metabolite transporter (DMT)-like permease n=1 Tax=Cryobacterium roopkundense TaxID=1001240 RepID=A0A7W8ZZ68_9MICO|nr:EamA family transporter [Cryobacterium roopkundense]MBB5642934.1 drug/metabolite transporter (DMT)-like permease [Cryobacterium roopkundense]